MSNEVILNLSFDNQTVTDLTGNWTLSGTPNVTYEQISGGSGYSPVTGTLGTPPTLVAVDQEAIYNEYTIDFNLYAKPSYTDTGWFSFFNLDTGLHYGGDYRAEVDNGLTISLQIGGSSTEVTIDSPTNRWIHITIISEYDSDTGVYTAYLYVDSVLRTYKRGARLNGSPFAIGKKLVLLNRGGSSFHLPNTPGLAIDGLTVIAGIHVPNQKPAISLLNLSRVFNNFCTWLKGKLSTVALTGSYNDLSDKPTISTVNDGTLTIQQNGTNVQTFTANQSTNATANITVPTKTSDLTNDSGFLTLESLSTNSIPFHNSYPRCKYLGTTITSAQNTAIKNRTYDDLFIGDYWTINNVNWRIVAIEYYYNVGNTNFDKGNIIVMPDTVLYSAQMNTTNTTTGAYASSLMRTQNLNSARTIAQNAFGSHLANHKILLANAVDSSGPSSWGWYDSDGVELPNEVQIYGVRVWGSALKGYDVATQKQQFPLLALAPQFVNIRQNYWLQDVSSRSVSSDFADVSGGGHAGADGASSSLGVRPSVTLSYI